MFAVFLPNDDSNIMFNQDNYFSTLDKRSCFFIIMFAVFLPNDDSDIMFHQDNYFIFKTMEIKTLSGFDFWILRVRTWLSTFRGQLRSKIILLFEILYYNFLSNTYDTFYLEVVLRRLKSKSSTDNFSRFRTVFEIFDFKVLRVRPWTLTFRGYLRSNLFSPFDGPYMISYLTSIDISSLFHTVKNMSIIRNPAHDFLFKFHWNCFSISYRFEIFDFKIFMVWSWPLTSKKSSGVKHLITIRKTIYDFLFVRVRIHQKI